ncbi:MAG TPA: Stp1/IreP family PP2C-type Ser/Thr phosphatase [Blastocatellia bacterium]|nr:Stp1/IreP family PP2C-type Ser/Thr phosphatase [Blastocatellia bacterium]
MFGFWKRSRKKAERLDDTRPPQTAAYQVVASLLSDVGCVRELNEDSGVFHQPDDPQTLADKGMLFLVCDGMGGHSGGEVASGLAVKVIGQAYYESDGGPIEALEKAFRKANKAIFDVARKNGGLQGMGTTGTALVLHNGRAIAAHVGDSRLYLVRDGQIYLMTQDHSAVMEMVKQGILSLDEARHHPDKNVILRALGSHEEVEVSVWDEPFPVREGDRFLLCSDGLYDLVQDEEIRQIVRASAPEVACANLVSLAKQRGGHDNVTVIVICLKPAVGEADREIPETREVGPPKTRTLEY